MIVSNETKITHFIHLEYMSAGVIFKVLWEKALRFGHIYKNQRKGAFIERLYESFRRSLSTYWEGREDATLQLLV